MSKLEVTQIESKEDRVEIRWQITADDDSNPKNYFGQFSVGDQAAIDEAFKKAIASYEFVDTVRQTYAGKLVSLDAKGVLAVSDKPTLVADPVQEVPQVL